LQFNFHIIHHPSTFNKANALFQHPDLKEGIAQDDENSILLDNKYFSIHAASIKKTNLEIHKHIRKAQEQDHKASLALKTILWNGPKSITKGLKEWNYEDGLILK
jgi:hypothetical protein